MQRELAATLLVHFHITGVQEISVEVEVPRPVLQDLPNVADSVVNMGEDLLAVSELVRTVTIK